MKIAGLLVVMGGWCIAVSGLFISSSNMARAVFAGTGIAVSLIGSLGILNKYYLNRDIWKQ